MKHKLEYLLIAATVSIISGCATSSAEKEKIIFPQYHQTQHLPVITDKIRPSPLKLSLLTRLPQPKPISTLTDSESENKYSFVISNMEVHEALRLFASAYDLNIVVDNDVEGILDVEFHSLPLKQAIPLMLGSSNYYWEVKDGIIQVHSQETRQFAVDYLRLLRKGEGSSSATVTSGSSASSESGGQSGGEAGSVSITHTDEVNFWEELEAQLKALASPTGRIVISKLAGTVVVSDQHARVEEIANYLAQIQQAVHRQVDIQVTIIEVSLDDSSALGVNWTRIADAMDPTNTVSLNINGRVTTPAGGIPAKPQVLGLTYKNTSSDNQVSALISALQEQGNVQVVSQPHIRTINNQTSLIKVGTDRTFFRREQSTDSTSAGSITTATDIAQVVTEGVVLSITPQISANGWILMDISPVVTRVSSVATVLGNSGNVQSSAPNLDVAQVTSLVRARSGEPVVIGGLIQTQESITERNIPGTRWMGAFKNLAGGTYKSMVKKELIMVVTPVIVASE
ncbi:MAG: secretin N-terminal domain-containing protein [Granulosicoccus sp.]